jgi:hypothetical protein
VFQDTERPQVLSVVVGRLSYRRRRLSKVGDSGKEAGRQCGMMRDDIVPSTYNMKNQGEYRDQYWELPRTKQALRNYVDSEEEIGRTQTARKFFGNHSRVGSLGSGRHAYG